MRERCEIHDRNMLLRCAECETQLARDQLRQAEAEIERLRADLVWAVRQGAWFTDGPETFIDDCDDTPDSICRAVREARTSVTA